MCTEVTSQLHFSYQKRVKLRQIQQIRISCNHKGKYERFQSLYVSLIGVFTCTLTNTAVFTLLTLCNASLSAKTYLFLFCFLIIQLLGGNYWGEGPKDMIASPLPLIFSLVGHRARPRCPLGSYAHGAVSQTADAKHKVC